MTQKLVGDYDTVSLCVVCWPRKDEPGFGYVSGEYPFLSLSEHFKTKVSASLDSSFGASISVSAPRPASMVVLNIPMKPSSIGAARMSSANGKKHWSRMSLLTQQLSRPGQNGKLRLSVPITHPSSLLVLRRNTVR